MRVGGVFVMKILDCYIMVSSNSGWAITFIFGLMPLGKVWTSLSLIYQLKEIYKKVFAVK